jgi:predicted nucleic acid-binding protein
MSARAPRRSLGYLLDTTVAIDWSLGYPGVRDVVERCFEETDLLYTCDVVVCEALSGDSPLERETIRRFLGALEYVALDPPGAADAGELRRLAGRSGRHSLGDALLAATARRLGATIVTRNAADYAAYSVPVIGYGPV